MLSTVAVEPGEIAVSKGLSRALLRRGGCGRLIRRHYWRRGHNGRRWGRRLGFDNRLGLRGRAPRWRLGHIVAGLAGRRARKHDGRQ